LICRLNKERKIVSIVLSLYANKKNYYAFSVTGDVRAIYYKNCKRFCKAFCKQVLQSMKSAFKKAISKKNPQHFQYYTHKKNFADECPDALINPQKFSRME